MEEALQDAGEAAAARFESNGRIPGNGDFLRGAPKPAHGVPNLVSIRMPHFRRKPVGRTPPAKMKT